MGAMRLSLLFATALTIALVWAAPASAGTVCNIAGIATFAAADVGASCPGGANNPSEVNSLSVSRNAAGDTVFTDANAPMTDGDGPGGCSVSGNTGTCPGTTGFVFDLGAGDDTATVGAVLSDGMSTGGAGADHLQGGPLGDMLGGGTGDDVVEGGAGDDILLGGSGVDTVRGGAGSDVLRGDDGPDTLEGGPGRDSLAGGTGDDTESGGDDGDVLDGGVAPGCDGAEGSDILNGDGGDDALCGGAGSGAPDNDSLN